MNQEVAENGNSSGGGGELCQAGYESVSSTEDVLANSNVQVSQELLPGNTTLNQDVGMMKAGKKISFKLVYGLMSLLFAIVVSLLWIDTQEGGRHLVPT